MNQIKMLETASEEIQVRAQLITLMPSAESAREEYLKAHGYASGMYDLGIFNQEQFGAAADLLKAAIDAAKAKEKATPSTANAESGKENLTKSSVDEKMQIVKPTAPTVETTAFWLNEMIVGMRNAHIDSHQAFSALVLVVSRIAGGELK